MDNARFGEFFEGDNQRLSMTRLTCFLAFFPSSWVMLRHPSEEMMLYYLGAFVLGYVGGKGFDAMTSAAVAKAQGPAPQNVIVAPVAPAPPPAPPIVLPDAQNVSVSSQNGDVNVTSRSME